MLAGRWRGRKTVPGCLEASPQSVERVLHGSRSPQPKLVPRGGQPDDDHRPSVLEPRPDALQAVTAWLERVGRGVQGGAEVGLVFGRRGHASRSRIARSACIALAVWLFTAPRLIRMVSAICASGMSA